MGASTLSLGIVYQENLDATATSMGLSGLAAGDQKGYWRALISHINSEGGVAGHQLEPVFAGLKDRSDASFEAACARLTQDNKVFAVFFVTDRTDNFLQCTAKAGTVTVGGGLTLSDTATFQRFPNYLEVNTVNLDRLAVIEVNNLADRKFFAGPSRVGIVTYDLPSFRHAVDEVMVPELRRRGAEIDSANVVKVALPYTEGGMSDAQAAISAAVLKFRAAGVDRVLLFDGSAEITLLFLNNAESQRYRPRYGLTTQNGAQALLTAGVVPAEQLIGAIGVGWLPFVDLPPSANPDSKATGARARCLAVLRQGGQTWMTPNAQNWALASCDGIWLFKAAAEAGGSPVSASSFQIGLARLRRSYASTLTMATSFEGGRRDGAAAMRELAFDQACGCFQYTGPLRPI